MGPPPRPPHGKPAPDKAGAIVALLTQERTQDAAALALRWVSQSPGAAEASHFASVTQHKIGQDARALMYAERAASLEPRNAFRHITLARLQYLMQEPDKAIASMERSLQLNPGDRQTYIDFCIMLGGQRRYIHGLRVAEAALQRFPGDGNVVANAASLLVSTGRVNQALHVAGEIARAVPGDTFSRSLRCLIANYIDMPAIDQFRLHEDYGACVAAQPRRAVPRPARMPNGRLRLGLMSSDLRAHSVSSFLEPLLEHLDRSRFDVFVYHTNKLEDAVTTRLKAHASRWWMRNSPEPEELARQIASGSVDVLLDVGGHTHPTGLLAAAFRPAPVQVTYLGYPNTTGLRAMDWRIVDNVTDPAGAESLATERLLRLDECFLCYQPPEEATRVTALADGPVTFVSFNSLQKIGARCAGLWAAVLEKVPGSRLVLKMTNLVEPELREEVTARLASWGLTPSRTTILMSMESRAEHLSAYAQAHVALDTFPYHGTTTTCEAMWMGVPVLTLAGDRHAARVGASLLSAVGVPELIATTDDEFVEKAAALARDRPRLSEYRATLRGRMQASPLCDGPGFARRFGDAMERIATERHT